MSRAWGATRFAETGPFTSVMLGLWLGREAADLLALDGYQPAESLHITLAHLGEADAYDEIDLAHILVAAEQACWEPLSGEVSGIGRFYASDDSNGADVVWAAPSVDGLAELRQRLIDYLPSKASEAARGRWVPHITLAYVDAGADWPVLALPTVPLAFDGLTVSVAGKATLIPFRRDSYYYRDLTHMARADGSARLFNEVQFAEAPATVPVLPKPGTYQHPTYGEVEMTAERIARYVANHNARVYQQHIPIDAEHETALSGALGYVGDLFLNEDGSASASVEWTDRGRKLIETDRFKYVSPTLYPNWQDAGTEEWHEDVLIGLAVTTRPFFKDSYLAPLVASEAGLRMPDVNDPAHQRFSEMPFTRQEVQDVATENKPAGEQPTTQQFGELSQRFTELEQKFSDSETKREAAETELATIKAAGEERAYREEILGKVDGGVRWFGDVDTHLAILKALPDEQRQAYIESNRKQATQIEASIKAGAPIGSEGGAGKTFSAVEGEVAAAVKAFRETDAGRGTTEAQAFTAVLQANPDLRKRLDEAQAA